MWTQAGVASCCRQAQTLFVLLVGCIRYFPYSYLKMNLISVWMYHQCGVTIPRIYTLPFGGYRILSSQLKYCSFAMDRECSGACRLASSRDIFWTSLFHALLSSASILVKMTTTGTAPSKCPVRYLIIVNLQHICLPLPVPHREKKLFSAVVIGRESSTGMQYLYYGIKIRKYFWEIFAYQIACNWSRSFVCFARWAMKSFTMRNSESPPASKPRESWNMKPGLLLNTISFSILWIPR